jgi:hypothetical protein
MRDELIVQSLVTGCRLDGASREAIKKALERMEGKRVRIALSEVKKRRSLSQNRFYFGVVIPIIRSMFEKAGTFADSEEVHTYLKSRVGKMEKRIALPDGSQWYTIGSSSKLTTGEWEDFITAIRAWAADFGVIVPIPNEGMYS